MLLNRASGQLSQKVASAVSIGATLTVFEVLLLSVQFTCGSESSTVWFPFERPRNVFDPLGTRVPDMPRRSPEKAQN